MTDTDRPDLDRLEATHAEEEKEEARRTLIDTSRPMGLRAPRGGRLPQSERWLERLYAGDRVVREKKPGVFDHLRSVGPWFVSVDDEPLSVLDGMSQTATVCAGFCEDEVVRCYAEGELGDTILVSDDTSAADHPLAERYADLLRHLVPDLPHVTFTNSGAEACEKALGLCRLQARDKNKQRRVLAFEGSFHGRTLMALHASYNPKKRAPFEIAGHEVTYASYPLWKTPQEAEPPPPPGLLAAVAEGDLGWVRSSWSAGDDALLAAEIHTLTEVHRQLRNGECFAVIIEPMQSEGGDRG